MKGGNTHYYGSTKTGKAKYSQWNTKNGKRKGNLIPKNEEITIGKAHKNIWKLIWYISTITDAFLNQKRVNVC